MKIPYFEAPIKAGFPSPAEDYLDQNLDLNDYLIQHPAATFFVRVDGDSMIGANIHKNDLLVVDKALDPSNGKIVVAILNGEFTVKRFRITDHHVFLEPENPKYKTIEITPDTDFRVWGVVTYVIHKCTH
ncbi:MAG: peptidase S24 [Chlamydiae bacterium CG10_big_fil_rev_8_21_14_0_10_42_34]|nr:MAG: peptidase S24 [Chlamydiae bacterium CG10_big_fil_rev_8_21_14_0_10_42_34]